MHRQYRHAQHLYRLDMLNQPPRPQVHRSRKPRMLQVDNCVQSHNHDATRLRNQRLHKYSDAQLGHVGELRGARVVSHCHGCGERTEYADADADAYAFVHVFQA
jgi:hypothetical protein